MIKRREGLFIADKSVKWDFTKIISLNEVQAKPLLLEIVAFASCCFVSCKVPRCSAELNY